ncbi:MAG: EpsD family peptidyl-prolyl cis-trans isomerase [Pseudomonadota bacterium]
MFRQASWSALITFVVLSSSLLAACGGGERAAPAGQVAATVNKGEISLHQVQYVLQRQPRLAGQPDAPRVALESLVEQELAAQAAREEGIESDPSFVQGMEAAKRELLARFYQERLATKAARPTTDEVDRYYDEHPALFAERRLYTLQEFVVEVSPEALATLREVVSTARSATELATALDRSGLRYRSGMTVQAPEAVQLRLLEPLAKLREGESMLLSGAPHARIWTLVRTQEAKVDRQQAREPIEAYLLTERKRQIVTARMQELRKSATVVLASQFAASAPAAAASAH